MIRRIIFEFFSQKYVYHILYKYNIYLSTHLTKGISFEKSSSSSKGSDLSEIKKMSQLESKASTLYNKNNIGKGYSDNFPFSKDAFYMDFVSIMWG